MREIFNALRDLDQPILIPKLESKMAPHAGIIYSIALIFLGLIVISAISMLLLGNVTYFITVILGVIVEFVIIRMFCEYLISSVNKS